MNKKGVYIVLDLETTGLLAGFHGISEIAAVALDKQMNILETLNFDVCPPQTRAINDFALNYSHMTRERLAAGKNYETTCKEFSAFVDRHFDDAPTYIGQFFPFDFSYLVDMYVTCGLQDECLKIFRNKFLDTKVIANYLNLKAEKSGEPIPFPTTTSLSSAGGLKDVLGVTGHLAHSAIGDVLATREVLLKLLEFK
jgi:DNA polymerase III epsilon subunit-like protein